MISHCLYQFFSNGRGCVLLLCFASSYLFRFRQHANGHTFPLLPTFAATIAVLSPRWFSHDVVFQYFVFISPTFYPSIRVPTFCLFSSDFVCKLPPRSGFDPAPLSVFCLSLSLSLSLTSPLHVIKAHILSQRARKCLHDFMRVN